nr:MAG: hypothetical protein [Microvirus sp.]
MARRNKNTKKININHPQNRTPVRNARRVFNNPLQRYPQMSVQQSLAREVFSDDLMLQSVHVNDRRAFSMYPSYLRTFAQIQPIRFNPTRNINVRFNAIRPKSVLGCVRRKIRREIMFATGFGGSRKKRRVRRNATSAVSC